jgi:hypothetical protein
MTFLLIILIIISSWFIGRDIIYKTHPFSYQQSNLLDKSPNTTLNSSSFPMAFILVNADNVPIEYEGYVNFYVQEQHYKINEEGDFVLSESIKHKLRKCEHNDFVNFDKDSFNNLGFTNYILLTF